MASIKVIVSNNEVLNLCIFYINLSIAINDIFITKFQYFFKKIIELFKIIYC